MERLIYTLPEGEPVWGLTLLAHEIYLLRQEEATCILKVYDVITYRFRRCLTVPNAKRIVDITSCEHYRLVYASDHNAECVHRLDVYGNATKWAVDDRPWELAVNREHNVIVKCLSVRKIKEFSSHGEPQREITLPDDIANPQCAIQTRSDQFVVCHGGVADEVHRVCAVRVGLSPDDCQIVHAHGGRRGSGTGQYNEPIHLAADDDEYVYVLDMKNRRVTLLSPTLEYIRQVVSRGQLTWRPARLCLDTQRHLLYVAVNDWNYVEAKWTSGRVMVFSV